MAKKRLTPNQKEWQKQARRISKFIKSASKRGYRFTDLPFEVDADMKPLRPERITKKILSALKKFTQKTAYKYAEYTIPAPTTEAAQAVYFDYDIEYDRVISGEAGRELERKVSARKGLYTRLGISDNEETSIIISQAEEIYQHVLDIITTVSNFNPNPQSEAGLQILHDARANDERGLFERLISASAEIISEAEGFSYQSKQEEREFHLFRFVSLIQGTTLTAEQAQQLTEQYYDTI